MKLQQHHQKEDIPSKQPIIPHPIVNNQPSSNSSLESTVSSTSNVSFLYQYFVFMSYILGQSQFFTFKIIFLKSLINENVVHSIQHFSRRVVCYYFIYLHFIIICTKKIGRNISYIDARELQFFPLSSIDMSYKIHM